MNERDSTFGRTRFELERRAFLKQVVACLGIGFLPTFIGNAESLSTPEKPPNLMPSTLIQYGNINGWGWGRFVELDGAPERTVPDWVNLLFDRHEYIEERLSNHNMNMHFDLMVIDGDTNNLFHTTPEALGDKPGGVGLMQDLIEHLVRRARRESRKVTFSLDIRVPPFWTKIRQNPGDVLLSEVEELFLSFPDHFSPEFLETVTFDLSIDPELPGLNSYRSQGSRKLTADDLNNLYDLLKRVSPKSRLFYYDMGMGSTDGLIEGADELDPAITMLFMGKSTLERKRIGVLNKLPDLGLTRQIGMMLSDKLKLSPYLSPPYTVPGYADVDIEPDQISDLVRPFTEEELASVGVEPPTSPKQGRKSLVAPFDYLVLQ